VAVAEVSVEDMERLHRALGRLEGQLDGFKVEIVGGNIVMYPLRPHHGRTIRLVWNTLAEQLPAEWDPVSDVSFVFDDKTELCPDLAVIPLSESDKNLSKYPCELIEVAIEVVSPSSVDRAYKDKVLAYAGRGIPVYLVFDPYAAQCVAMWEPIGDDYASRVTIHYGSSVQVTTPVGDLAIDTASLPVDQRG
jgi:Uma2 family endonuclease